MGKQKNTILASVKATMVFLKDFLYSCESGMRAREAKMNNWKSALKYHMGGMH